MEQINIYSNEKIISRIFVGEGLDGLAESLKSYDKVYVVMDREVANNCPAAAQIADILNEKGSPGMLIDAYESEKTMNTVMDICAWLLDEGADRDALILAVGGGITSDMVGFAASIYKRGVRFAYVPTTLLAQVDAAIGGKTGVNFERYKKYSASSVSLNSPIYARRCLSGCLTGIFSLVRLRCSRHSSLKITRIIMMLSAC
jgi:3-dehydroquinate synthetase